VLLLMTLLTLSGMRPDQRRCDGVKRDYECRRQHRVEGIAVLAVLFHRSIFSQAGHRRKKAVRFKKQAASRDFVAVCVPCRVRDCARCGSVAIVLTYDGRRM
jgi:hypothetical protein